MVGLDHVEPAGATAGKACVATTQTPELRSAVKIPFKWNVASIV